MIVAFSRYRSIKFRCIFMLRVSYRLAGTSSIFQTQPATVSSHRVNWIIESAHLQTSVDSQKWYKLVSREKTKIHLCCLICLLAQLNPDKHRSVLDSSIVSFFRLLILVLHVGVATTIKKKQKSSQ